jgi:hypothetical protein
LAQFVGNWNKNVRCRKIRGCRFALVGCWLVWNRTAHTTTKRKRALRLEFKKTCRLQQNAGSATYLDRPREAGNLGKSSVFTRPPVLGVGVGSPAGNGRRPGVQMRWRQLFGCERDVYGWQGWLLRVVGEGTVRRSDEMWISAWQVQWQVSWREGGLGRDIDGWWWVWCADDVGVPVSTGGVGEI